MILRDNVVTLLALDKVTLDAYEYHGEKEVWAMGHHRAGLQWATRIFEAHQPDYILNRQVPTNRPWWYENVVAYSSKMPVHTLHDWSGVTGFKGSRFQPNLKTNVQGREYIESSVGYMLASVLWCRMYGSGRNVNRLRLYGISFNNTPDYAYQRPNAMYYVGRLEQSGVEIEFPLKGCQIFSSRWPSGIYGLTENLDEPKN